MVGELGATRLGRGLLLDILPAGVAVNPADDEPAADAALDQADLGEPSGVTLAVLLGVRVDQQPYLLVGNEAVRESALAVQAHLDVQVPDGAGIPAEA